MAACRSAQKEGIWAWDCIHKELILVFLTVLALLGDNLMHSEFACHIGLRGKFFCHACWVKGSDAQDSGNLPNISGNDTPQTSPAPSAPVSEDRSFKNVLPSEDLPPPTMSVPLSTSPASNIPTLKWGKYKEFMTAMFNCISAFIKVIIFIEYCGDRLTIEIIARKTSHKKRNSRHASVLFHGGKDNWSEDQVEDSTNRERHQGHSSRILSRKAICLL